MIDEIGRILAIKKDSGELRSVYRSRVIFSMIGILIRVGVINVNEEYKSQRGLLNTIENKLKLLLSYVPETREWFKDYSEYEISRIIFEKLNSVGEVMKVGFNTDYVLSPYQTYLHGNSITVFKGFKPDIHIKSSGLMTYYLNNNIDKVDEKKNDFFNFYKIHDNNSYDILNEIKKNTEWVKVGTISGELFNFKSNDILAKSWGNFSLLENELSIIKRNIDEFFFIKKVNESILESKIDPYLVKKYEPLRYMLALKKNKAKGQFYKTENYIRLRLYNKLPLKELSILSIFSWPINDIDDAYNYLIDRRFWLKLKSMLENLYIELKESKNEL